jgi:DNA (cytosine-5)-methyltransferase 1
VKALDCFCCAGGATRGLQQAGYEVTGIDTRPQPHYCGDRFYQDDAMAWLRGERETLDSFDLIWASPPCQRYSELTPADRKEQHPDLLPEVGALLRAQPTPFILENVELAKHLLRSPIMLCGSMLGLPIWRHRYFEVGNVDLFFLLPPCDHSFIPILISGQGSRKTNGIRQARIPTGVKQRAIGTPWMNRDEMSECIPPAYSRFLAERIQEALNEPVHP